MKKYKSVYLIGGFFMAKSPFSTLEKYEIITAYENRSLSSLEFCRQINLARSTIKHWIHLFKTYGLNGLQGGKWKGYSKEVKQAAVLDHLSGGYSLRELIRKYEISSVSVLRSWIKHYNGHRKLEDTIKGMRNSMNKSRSTTLKERLEIVSYCLVHQKNFHQTAQHFHVSYQQVYQWVKKFEESEEKGLQDKRGKHKQESELSPEEKMKLQMKHLEQENERLKAENGFLKKLEELERRRF
jgi:transposase